jgi:hypothetical protein
MKPHTQAVREAQAWNRILLAIKKRAKADNADASSLDVTNRDPGLQQLFRMEALADFLEGKSAEQPEEQPQAPADATPADATPAKATEAKPAKGKSEGGTL